MPSQELTDKLFEAQEAYIMSDRRDGYIKMAQTRALYKRQMIHCPRVWMKMDAILKEADGLISNPDWSQIQQNIYEQKKNQIDRAVDLQLREWSQNKFFNAGMFAGNVDLIFLNNAPEPVKIEEPEKLDEQKLQEKVTKILKEEMTDLFNHKIGQNEETNEEAQIKERRKEAARAQARAALEAEKKERESETYNPKVTMEDLERKIIRPPPVIVNPAPRPKPQVQKQNTQEPSKPVLEKSLADRAKNVRIPLPDIRVAKASQQAVDKNTSPTRAQAKKAEAVVKQERVRPQQDTRTSREEVQKVRDSVAARVRSPARRINPNKVPESQTQQQKPTVQKAPETIADLKQKIMQEEIQSQAKEQIAELIAQDPVVSQTAPEVEVLHGSENRDPVEPAEHDQAMQAEEIVQNQQPHEEETIEHQESEDIQQDIQLEELSDRDSEPEISEVEVQHEVATQLPAQVTEQSTETMEQAQATTEEQDSETFSPANGQEIGQAEQQEQTTNQVNSDRSSEESSLDQQEQGEESVMEQQQVTEEMESQTDNELLITSQELPTQQISDAESPGTDNSVDSDEQEGNTDNEGKEENHQTPQDSDITEPQQQQADAESQSSGSTIETQSQDQPLDKPLESLELQAEEIQAQPQPQLEESQSMQEPNATDSEPQSLKTISETQTEPIDTEKPDVYNSEQQAEQQSTDQPVTTVYTPQITQQEPTMTAQIDSLVEETKTTVLKDGMAPAKFAAGWYYGITGEDRRRDVRHCFAVDDELTNLLYDAMASYIEGNMEIGDQKMHETKPLLQQSLSSCGQIAMEMNSITEQFSSLRSQGNWDQLAAEVYNQNKDRIEAAVRMQLEQWKKHKYFYSGSYAGYVEKIFLDVGLGIKERDDYAPASFWAGRYAAIFGEDMSEFILACFEPSPQLTDIIYNSMEAYIQDGTGYKTMHDTKILYEKAMEDCGYINEEMDEVLNSLEEMQICYFGIKLEAIQNRPDWDKIFAALYEENKSELLSFMQEELSAWKVSNYFGSGVAAGSIESLILTKFEDKSEKELEQLLEGSSGS